MAKDKTCEWKKTDGPIPGWRLTECGNVWNQSLVRRTTCPFCGGKIMAVKDE
ncbi:hypothetical protein LCGC14_1730890 [marine sediment metagenome]|uniref:Uncharacterized protein n=1 Tax=marine sediment metagenome TaxID=412755 RepID=A0A0F9JQ67_9ZZZZ